MLHDPQREVIFKATHALLDAARYVESRGWCQHAMQSRDGRVCIFGALRAVCTYDDQVQAEIVRRLRKAVGFKRRDQHDGAIAKWNDTKGRTKEQVIGALKRAAR